MTTDTVALASRRSRVETLATARILVAFLGEKSQFDWWPTSFFTPTGLRFLEYNFPRTTASAAVHSVSQAAKSLHDQRIGTAGSFHLFRLPHELEQDVHTFILEASKDALSHLFVSQAQSIEELKQIGGGEGLSAVGPIRVSSVGQITTRPSLTKTAAYYWSAFLNGTQVFPYFTID